MYRISNVSPILLDKHEFLFLASTFALSHFQVMVRIPWNYYVEWSWIYLRMLKNTQNIDRVKRVSAMCVGISFLRLFFVFFVL